MDDLPRIVGVAIMDENGVPFHLPAPARHGDVFKALDARCGGNPNVAFGEQGFWLDNGTFLGRVGALFLARDNGQMLNKGRQYHDELYSEDLW